MPELPEVASFRKYFERTSLKKKIAFVQVKDPRIVREISSAELEKELTGQTFLSSRQHGKYMFAETDSGKWLVLHFGMTGFLHYFENREEDPAYDRFVIGFKNNGFLAYVNQRMLGWIGLTRDPEEIVKQKGLGPAVLDNRFDFALFMKNLSGRKGEIKPTLMDQALVAGVGNIYSDEILFQARIHPKTKVNALDENKLRDIFHKMKEVLQTAVDRDADTEKFPEKYLLRNRKKGAECPVSGDKLETMKVAGRTAYFCPRCQPRSG
jgi:formamidopyrimidine-DNA glycosylase